MTQLSFDPIQTNQREKMKNRKREIDKNELRHRLLLLVIRIEQKRIPKKGLRWNPPGKRKQGRLKMTLKKTFQDGSDMGNGEKGVAALSLLDRCKERRRRRD